MKNFFLITANILIAMLAFSQQPVKRGKNTIGSLFSITSTPGKETCVYSKDDVYFYVLSEAKNYEKCNSGGNEITTFEVKGKIVNRNKRDIKVSKADLFLNEYYLSCRKKGSSDQAIAAIKQPLYVRAGSEVFFDYHAIVNLLSGTGMPVKVTADFIYSHVEHIPSTAQYANQPKPWFPDCGSFGFMELSPFTKVVLDPSLLDTSHFETIRHLKKKLEYCPENYFIYAKLGDIYYKKRDVADKNWINLSIHCYKKAIYHVNNGIGDVDKKMEIWLIDYYWNLANLYEYAGMYEHAIQYFEILKKYSPEYLKNRYNELIAQYGAPHGSELNLNFAEESMAHIITCRFLMKYRIHSPSESISNNSASSVVPDEDVDMSAQAIAQRSGLAPVAQMAEEVEKKNNYSKRDPEVKGKAISLALYALSWAIAPKDMKADQRNRFIMGALSTLVSLIDQDKIAVSAGGLSSDGMLADLAGLKSSA